jgi:hypothetical protein
MTGTKKNKAKGFYFDAEHNKYRARITVNGTTYHLGYFKNQTLAARAYKEAEANYR